MQPPDEFDSLFYQLGLKLKANTNSGRLDSSLPDLQTPNLLTKSPNSDDFRLLNSTQQNQQDPSSFPLTNWQLSPSTKQFLNIYQPTFQTNSFLSPPLNDHFSIQKPFSLLKQGGVSIQQRKERNRKSAAASRYRKAIIFDELCKMCKMELKLNSELKALFQ